MTLYRIYSLTPEGIITGLPFEIELPNDAAAIQKAKSRLDGVDLEVRDGRRRVAIVNYEKKK
jgi:hypothetical protein